MKSGFAQLSFLHFLNDGFLASLMLILPFIRNDLNISLTNIGLLSSLTSLTGIALALPAGILGHRYGGLRVLTACLFFYALGFFGIGISNSYLILILSFLVASLGFGLFHPIAFSLVAKWTDHGELGRKMGDFTAIGDVGRIIFSSSISFVIVAIGWKNTAFAYGAISLLFLFLVIKPLLRHREKTLGKKVIKPLSFPQIIRNYKFVCALLVSFFDNMASSALLVFIPFLLLEKQVDAKLLGPFTGAFIAGNLIGKFSLGRLADKFTNTTVFIAAEAMMAASIFLLTASSSFPLIISFSVLLGILTAGTIPVRSTMVTEATKHHGQYEKVFAITSVVATAATSLTPLILGAVADKLGIVFSFYLAGLFALTATIPAYLFTLKRQD